MSQPLSVFFLCKLLKLNELLKKVPISFQKAWLVHSYVDVALSRASPHGPLVQVTTWARQGACEAYEL